MNHEIILVIAVNELYTIDIYTGQCGQPNQQI